MYAPTYLLITAARNESTYIRRTIKSVMRQTVPPTLWVIADDGSTDDTRQIAEEYAAQCDFIRVIGVKSAKLIGAKDRFALGVDAVVFNEALSTVDRAPFGFIGKLDADVEFESDYYERVFAEFQNDDRLGICAGHFYEYNNDGVLALSRVPDWHVRGAGKVWRRECFEAIGGIRETMGWDGIDEVQAQLNGWYSRSLYDPKVTHLRPVGSGGGLLRGRANLGLCDWLLQYHPLFIVPRALKAGAAPPYIVGGFAYLYGYLRGCVMRPERFDDPNVVKFIRHSQLSRLRGGRPFAMSGEELRKRERAG